MTSGERHGKGTKEQTVTVLSVANVLRQKQSDGPEDRQECGVVTISD